LVDADGLWSNRISIGSGHDVLIKDRFRNAYQFRVATIIYTDTGPKLYEAVIISKVEAFGFDIDLPAYRIDIVQVTHFNPDLNATGCVLDDQLLIEIPFLIVRDDNGGEGDIIGDGFVLVKSVTGFKLGNRDIDRQIGVFASCRWLIVIEVNTSGWNGKKDASE
jgi:hypothetical protein